MVAGSCRLYASFHQLRKIDFHVLCLARSCPTSFQYLLNGVAQAVRVLNHQTIKFAALCLLQVPALQRLQVEADRGNRSFQFVSYRVDETVVLLVLSNFADQKAGIQDEPGHDGAKENNPEKDFDAFLPVQDYP